jgi:hypothetical protein
MRLAAGFDSAISLENAEGLCVNAKSIMGVMMLAAVCDSKLLVRATGTDAAEAVKSDWGTRRARFRHGDARRSERSQALLTA